MTPLPTANENEFPCDLCDGLGMYEKTYTYRDASGKLMTEGTGEIVRCWNCNAPDEDD